jgi:oligopeptide/dipeptide ABC transporter ATP-binding protein
MTILMEAEGLTKHFPGRRGLIDMARGTKRPVVQALTEINLDIRAGETLGIVGESGCGKSTLARCLVGLHTPDRGTVRFAGANLAGMTAAETLAFHRQVQMIFQDPYGSLNPLMSVGDTLAEALSVHAIVSKAAVAARVAELLAMVHLPPDAAARRPHEFSGGQRQRIGIARALAVEPKIIVADEPVSALDVSVQAQIVNLLLELRARLGLTLVFITHDLRLVRHMTQRVAVMYLGRVVELGPTADLFANPRHPYTRALLRAVPQLTPGMRGRDAAVRGELPSPLAPPPGCAFHPRCAIAEPRCAVSVPRLEARGGDWPVACLLAGS